MGTITHINTARERQQQREQAISKNKVAILSDRIELKTRAMMRLTHDLRAMWMYVCPILNTSGHLPIAFSCPWCGARKPGAPDDAA